jgi:hypothetical protein
MQKIPHIPAANLHAERATVSGWEIGPRQFQFPSRCTFFNSGYTALSVGMLAFLPILRKEINT